MMLETFCERSAGCLAPLDGLFTRSLFVWKKIDRNEDN